MTSFFALAFVGLVHSVSHSAFEILELILDLVEPRWRLLPEGSQARHGCVWP